MKTIIKIFFVFILSTIAVESVNAQAHYRRNVYGDFFTGMTMATMDMTGQNEYKKHKIGFIVGGNANFKFFHHLEFQTGFQLIKKGSLKHKKSVERPESMPILTTDVKTTIDANYIQIPLNLGFEVPIAKELFFNMHVGVFGAYGFKGYRNQKGFTKEESNPIVVSQDQGSTKTFSSSSLKKYDYGIGGNIGLVYDIYIFRLQYDHGLANVATTVLAGDGNEWKTRNYSICLGFRF